MMRFVMWALALFVALVLATAITLPAIIEARRNRVVADDKIEPGAAARRLHAQLFIADLHTDSLLWDRDLRARSGRGHVDLPRLREGNVALQVFSIVSKVPYGINLDRNDDTRDVIAPLAIAQRWPVRTWRSPYQRAMYQAHLLARLASEANSGLVLVQTRADLVRFVGARGQRPRLLAALLSVEGAHAIEGDLAKLDALYDAGVRMMAPTHFFDTDIGGSAHGVRKNGLTPLGRAWLERMEAKHMLVDLAHASDQTIEDVVALATRPVIISHAGVRATCDNPRNLSDAQLRAVAATGGVIGIGFWDTAVCGRSATAIARAIRHAADVAGVEHVAFGSDFDGNVTVPFDAAGLSQLTQALLDVGFSTKDVRLIAGENVLRVLRATLKGEQRGTSNELRGAS